MEQPIKKNKFSYFARSRLRLRPQEIWERDYLKTADQSGTRMFVSKKLERTKVLKTVSSTFKILMSSQNHSFSGDATIMVQETCAKYTGEHFVIICATQSG